MNWIKRLFSKNKETVVQEKLVQKPVSDNEWVNSLLFESRMRTNVYSVSSEKKINKQENSVRYSSNVPDDTFNVINNAYTMSSLFNLSSSIGSSFDSKQSSNIDFGGGSFSGGGSGGEW